MFLSYESVTTLATLGGVVSLLLLAALFLAFIVSDFRKYRGIVGSCLVGVALVSGLLGALLCYTNAKNMALPDRADLIAKLKGAGTGSDRSTIMRQLTAAGFEPELHENSYADQFPGEIQPDRFAVSEITQSASYISLATGILRAEKENSYIMNQYLATVFLFDSQQRLITWKYWIVTPPF